MHPHVKEVMRVLFPNRYIAKKTESIYFIAHKSRKLASGGCCHNEQSAGGESTRWKTRKL